LKKLRKKRRRRTKTRNRFEQRIEEALTDAGLSFDYESEKIPYVIKGNYIPDFIIQSKTGPIYLETKGHFRPEAKRKMAAVKAQHPDIDLRILFYSHKLKDIKWAEKNGIKYAISEIPEDWFNGL
jgi:predicted nuclease of restriction endonuclease-like RecB superfamily